MRIWQREPILMPFSAFPCATVLIASIGFGV
jgi:hypothetical protein